MIIVFQCFGGTHTSVVAASIYLGRLPRTGRPALEQILALPYFDRNDAASVGSLFFDGFDCRGNIVCILGSGGWGSQIRNLLASVLELARDGESVVVPEVAVIDCLPEAGPAVRVGGFISRRLGFTALGRPLVSRGIIGSYPRLLKLVQRFESDPAPFLLK